MGFRYERRYQGPLRGVILDWAGTTVDHGCLAPAVTFIEAFRGVGIDIGTAEARAPMGMAKWYHVQAIIRMPAVAEAWRARYGAPANDADVDRIYERFLPLQVETVTRHSEVIAGVVEVAGELRRRDLRIGSTTGYPREVADVVSSLASAQGYAPDCVVCAGDTRLGRPGPFMVFKALIDLELSPVEAVVKVGDTVVDVEEGLNGGLWSVGVCATGNEVGLTAAELAALPDEERGRRVAVARDRLFAAGAHYVIDSVAELPAVIDHINTRLAQGDKP
jgi:phosphonoacetaldehyde hydrolase